MVSTKVYGSRFSLNLWQVLTEDIFHLLRCLAGEPDIGGIDHHDWTVLTAAQAARAIGAKCPRTAPFSDVAFGSSEEFMSAGRSTATATVGAKVGANKHMVLISQGWI
jgi:hypothetical protein